MGKIHDALQRAEQERARLGGAPGGPGTPEVLQERAPAAGPDAPRKADRAEAVRSGRRARVITSNGSNVAEEYRTLRARIQSIRRSRDIRSLLITSAHAGEGKTTTAVNLALSFGLDLGGTTCLVDADMRTPAVHNAFPKLPDAGLAEVLETDAKLDEALIQVPDTRLSVLPVKSLPNYPSELLASAKMSELMAELVSRFDNVVIDAPPILGLPDAVSLSDLCDATLLIVGAGASARADIEAALERIDTGKLIGSVLNRAARSPSTYGYGYGARS